MASNDNQGSYMDEFDVDDNESIYEEIQRQSATEQVSAGVGKTVLEPLAEPESAENCWLVFGQVPESADKDKVYKTIALFSPVSPVKVEKRGRVLFNVLFATKEDADEAFKVTNFTWGKFVGKGRITEFYRVTYYADEIREDHSSRIIDAVKKHVGMDILSCTIQEKKKSVSVYFKGLPDFSFAMSEQVAANIKVLQAGPFAPAYYLHVNRCTAATSSAEVVKMQFHGVAPSFEEHTLLASLKDTLAPIIPRKCIIGVAIYRFPDTGRNSRFGFLYINGPEFAELLEKVEVPVPHSKNPIVFHRAVEKNGDESHFLPSSASSPSDNGDKRGEKRRRE